MKLYKLRHNPTGLFYTPSKGTEQLQLNLHKYTQTY